MNAGDRLALLWSIAFFGGSLGQWLSRVSALPAVVWLLAIGLVIGQAGLELIRPEDLGQGLEPLVGLLVSLVLFDGGLNLRLAGRELQRSVIQLVLIRAVLGLAGGAALAHLAAGLPWPLALVFGAIALATGPTVVTSLVRQMRLPPFLSQVLEAEGLLLEPFSAVLALLLLQSAMGDVASWQELTQRLVVRFGGGVAAGAVAGVLLAEPLRRLPADAANSALQLQLSLGVLFLLFSGCEALLPQSGLPAAVSAGMVVGLRLEAGASQLDTLIRQLAQLAITVLFPLLAADLSWRELSPLGLGGLVAVGALMLLRLLVVQVASVGLPLDGREKLLLGWVAPRGIVSAAVASLFALQLEEAGIDGGGTLKGLVFLTILLTVGVQGATAPWLARWLGLTVPVEAEVDGGVDVERKEMESAQGEEQCSDPI
ncbi:MAG: cation:proton antiporter [Cyanobacteriota bacterium]|nr:cation:proton antiporter [Cyanobacteriota bacterium]